MILGNRDNTDEIDRLRKERELFKRQFLKVRQGYEDKIRELSILKELSGALGSDLFHDRNALFSEHLKIIKKFRSPDSITLMLLNEDLQIVEVVAESTEGARGTDPKDRYAIRGGTPLSEALTEKRAIIIDGDPDTDTGAATSGAALYLPVMHNHNPLGLLLFRHRSARGFDQDHLRFLSIVADHMATTIVLSRLYNQMVKEEQQRFLLSRFFSRTVTEKILGSTENLRLGGDRKEVTILFADLKGFTSLSERLDQEKVVEILNAYFSHVTPLIFRHGGTLDKIMGDGLLALFGAPISHEKDPLLAVQAAIDIIQSLKSFNRLGESRNWPKLQVSIGINAGEVVAGYIGSEDHLNYTVIGDAVNVAQRIESIAGPDTLLISKTVLAGIEGSLGELKGLKGLTPMPAQKLKGKEKAIAVYRVEIAP